MQKEDQEDLEGNGPGREIDDPSLPEDETATGAEKYTEEDKPVEEVGEEEPIERVPVRRRGCLWGCLTPVAAVLAIILVLIVIGYAKRNALNSTLIKRIVINTQNRVLDKLPEDEVETVKADFEKVKIALKEGRIDEQALIMAIEEYHNAMRKKPSSEQGKEEIDRLIAGMNAAIINSEG